VCLCVYVYIYVCVCVITKTQLPSNTAAAEATYDLRTYLGEDSVLFADIIERILRIGAVISDVVDDIAVLVFSIVLSALMSVCLTRMDVIIMNYASVTINSTVYVCVAVVVAMLFYLGLECWSLYWFGFRGTHFNKTD